MEDLDGFLELAQAHASRGKRVPVGAVLVFHPPRAQAEPEAPPRHLGETRRDLREQSGRAVGVAGDERTDREPLRRAGDRRESGPDFEVRAVGLARKPEVVVEPEGMEAQALDRAGAKVEIRPCQSG